MRISEESVAELGPWLVACVADNLRREPESVAGDVPLAEYGLDSVTALAVNTQIEDHLGLQLAADLLWEYPTINELLPVLTRQLNAGENV